MSELHDNMAAVIYDRAAGVEDEITHLLSGTKFSATIETNLDPLTLPSQWSDDKREKVRLHVSQNQPRPIGNRNEIVTFMFQGQLCRFRVVDGYYSPASLQNQFLCIQVAAGDK